MNTKVLRVLGIGVSERPIINSHTWPFLGWARHGISLTRICYLPKTSDLRPAPQSEIAIYPTFSWSKLSFPFDAVSIARRLHAERAFDLIVADDPMGSGLVGWWLKRQTGLPLVIRCHSQYFGHLRWVYERPYYPLYYLLARFLLPRADVVQSISHAVGHSLLAMGVVPSRIEVGDDPVNPLFFEVLPRASDRPFQGRLLFVGYLTPRKGLPVLLDAVRLLVDAGKAPQLQLVGDGPLRARLQRQTTRLGIADRVTFVGYVSHAALVPFYQQSDVFVLPSLHEGLGRVLVEAALSGVPIVATQVGGIPEAVLPGKTALLVPPNDPSALATALGELFDDPARGWAMGARGRQFACEKFDPERVMGAIAATWLRAAGAGGGSYPLEAKK